MDENYRRLQKQSEQAREMLHPTEDIAGLRPVSVRALLDEDALFQRLMLRRGIEHNDVVEEEIIQQFGQWVVTCYGLECLTDYYPIEMERLDDDWVFHMAGKRWCNMDDFLRAYAFALRREGYEWKLVRDGRTVRDLLQEPGL